MSKGSVFVISAPAGSGKTTLADMLCDAYPEQVAESVSCTTRAPRGDEEDKRHYHFLSRAEFEEKREQGEFIEWAEVFGHLYGTLKSELARICDSGRHALLVIDVQGAEKLMGKVDATFVFIKPPSMEELKKRLQARSTDSFENIDERLASAETEMGYAKRYDHTIVNDDLYTAFQELQHIIGVL